MEPISVRDIKADGNARIHVGNSSVTHVHHYAEAPEEQPETPPAPFSLIPFSRDPDFIARSEILDQIATHCSQPAGRAALVGLGGVGKSQLAIEYSHQTAEKQNGAWVFWVHAGTRARVEEGFRAIADAVKLPGRHKPKADIPQLLSTWLSYESNGKWLLILDSADDADVFYGAGNGSGQLPLASYLPQSPNGSILLTSRDHSFAARLTGNFKSVIKVGPMKPDEALSFLEKKLGVLSQPAVGAELVSALDCIPLAINQAASYIQARAPRSTIQKYLAEFQESEKKSAKLLAHDAAELRRDGSSSNAIMKTWQISFDHIRSKKPSAADLLAVMSFFDNQSIPEFALNPEKEYDSDCDSDLESNWDSEELANQATMRSLVEAKQRQENSESEDEDDWSSEAGNDFEEDIALLRDYCLISVRESGTYFEMHRLVQLATKKWLVASKRHEEFKQRFITRLGLSVPTPDASNEIQLRDLFTHSQIAIGFSPNKTNLRFWFHLCCAISWYLTYFGQSHEAKAILDKALPAWGARKGEEHYEYLICQVRMANLLVDIDASQVKEAESILLKVLDVQKRVFATDASDTLSTMMWLADNYLQQERFSEAEQLQLYAIEKQTAATGLEHSKTLSYMSSLASTYSHQSRNEEAELLERQVLEISKRVLGPTHHETLARMTYLAAVYSDLSKYEEAAELQLQVLELRPALHEIEDQNSIKAKIHLAEIYDSQSLYERSLPIYEEVVQTLTAKLGEDHEQTLDICLKLASAFKLLGNYEQSEVLMLRVLEKLESRFGLAHEKTSHCVWKLAKLYSFRRRFKESKKLLLGLLSAQKAALEPHDSNLVNTMVVLGTVYECELLTEKSSEINVQVLALCEEKSDLEYLDGLGIWNIMAFAHFNDAKHYLVLAGILERLMNFYTAKYGSNSSFAIESISNLATVKELLELWDEAAELRFQLLQSFESRLGTRNAETLRRMAYLARARKHQGRFGEAKSLQSHIMNVHVEQLGAGHKKSLDAMQELARTLCESGDLMGAELLYRKILPGFEALYARGSFYPAVAAQELAHLVAEQAMIDPSREDEAVKLYQETIEYTGLEHGEDTLDVVRYSREASWKLAKMELYEEAARMAEAAWRGYTRIAGPDNDDTILCIGFLADILDSKGDYVRAMELQGEFAAASQRIYGPQHDNTMRARERYDDWVGELEEHVQEHAEEADHPFETCEACLASKIAQDKRRKSTS
ncbi:hypothetical protein PWT90_00460 [Aphanocladium album]|nr:hypothetical protein PWT90_00460 [Aphanocladium album]